MSYCKVSKRGSHRIFGLHTLANFLYVDVSQVDSAFYPPWDGKMSTSQRAVMFCDLEGNRRPDGK